MSFGFQSPDAVDRNNYYDAGSDPMSDPTSSDYWTFQQKSPPWIAAGYRSFALWSAAVGAQKAADETYRLAQIDALNRQSATAGGSAAASAAASRANAILQAQNEAARLAEEQRQFNENFGYNKARGDQQQQVSQGNLTGYYNGQNTLARDQMNQQGQQFNSRQALDYYTQLAQNAANPRNFVQSFFQQRGQVAPAAANGQGNVAAIQRYLPFLLGGNGGVAGGAPSAQLPSDSMRIQPYGPTQAGPDGRLGTRVPPMQNEQIDYIGQTNALNRAGGPAPQAPLASQALSPNLGMNDQTIRPSYNPSATPGLVQGSPEHISYLKSLAVDPTQDPLKQGPDFKGWKPDPRYEALGEFANGGSIMLHAPHFLVNAMNGHVTALAGEAGPEKVTFGGKAINDPYGTDQGPQYVNPDYQAPGDPYYTPPPPPEPFIDYNSQQYPNQPAIPQAPLPADAAAGTSTPVSSQYGYSGGVDLVNQVNQQQPTSSPAFSSPAAPTTTGPIQAPAGAEAPLANPFAGPTSGPAPSPTANLNLPADQGRMSPEQYVPQFVRQPLGVPQESNNFNASVPATGGGVTPLAASPQGTFNPGGGGMPQFLAGEDNNSVLNQLRNSNAVPPFLTRLFAQQQGIQSMGTNTPQQMELPKDVPLVSSLAYSQMTPSEQQALLSYVSAYGITPEDYLNLIRQYSPQGSSAYTPSFGNRFTRYLQ